jgi:hypothetical protein
MCGAWQEGTMYLAKCDKMNLEPSTTNTKPVNAIGFLCFIVVKHFIYNHPIPHITFEFVFEAMLFKTIIQTTHKNKASIIMHNIVHQHHYMVPLL